MNVHHHFNVTPSARYVSAANVICGNVSLWKRQRLCCILTIQTGNKFSPWTGHWSLSFKSWKNLTLVLRTSYLFYLMPHSSAIFLL